MFDFEITFELYGHFRCIQVLHSKWNYIYWVLSYSVGFQSSPRANKQTNKKQNSRNSVERDQRLLGKCSTNQGPGNGGVSVEREQMSPEDFAYQKIIMIGEAHNELVHQIGAKSDQRFLCKCVGSAHSIRDQKNGRSSLERDQK